MRWVQIKFPFHFGLPKRKPKNPNTHFGPISVWVSNQSPAEFQVQTKLLEASRLPFDLDLGFIQNPPYLLLLSSRSSFYIPWQWRSQLKHLISWENVSADKMYAPKTVFPLCTPLVCENANYNLCSICSVVFSMRS